MKTIYLSLLTGSYFFLAGCSFSQDKRSSDPIKEDSISSIDINKDTITRSKISSDLVYNENLELKKIYTDTVVFQQYMDYGDFDRFHVIARGKNLYPLNNNDDRSLNRGDITILEWHIDSIWIPEAPNDKWLSEYSDNIRKIKDGKLSLYKKKYLQPISFYYDDSIKNRYTQEDFDEIQNLVKYYLANSKNPLVISDVEIQSDSVQIQYSIEEKSRVENMAIGTYSVTYTVIGLSNYFDNHNSIFQWLYLKQNDDGYRDIYEYDLPNDTLILFN